MTIEKQVRLIAGTIILIGTFLAYSVSLTWLWLIAFVGVNLVQSSITGFCLMEIILKALPMNAGQSKQQKTKS